MNLSPSDRAEVRKLAAEIVAREIVAGLADPDELIVLSVPTIAALSGLTAKRVAQVMPIVDQGHKTKGVTLADYKRYLSAQRIPQKSNPTTP